MVVGLLLADGFSALCEICEGLSYGNEFRKGSLLPPLTLWMQKVVLAVWD